ncbi:cysteine synthase [Hahella sp. CCB-MM4]|uniref:YceK/YidQ family lipoprotein n=1 Tax=Hahella sp. (strain CCB-MM4) TaxID=1926491 RepID=UPI000B9BDE02|nr:YceK/YidQ family lipoprotein [Hahella sp. CCB-MM4]OZG71942.1 cysteine synthase [Hahella sp. CCB-MM4]
MLLIRLTATIGLLSILALQTGCGTINTLGKPEHVAAKNLKEEGSYCTSLPRVYSGVSYDLCRMYGRPAPVHAWQGTEGAATLWLVDLVVSGVLDTLALPYTMYDQSKYGDIELRSGTQ